MVSENVDKGLIKEHPDASQLLNDMASLESAPSPLSLRQCKSQVNNSVKSRKCYSW